MTSLSARVCSLLFVLATLTCPRLTHAADPASIDEKKDKAKNLFDAGLRAAESGDCTTAIPLFQESLATYRFETLGALFNLAQCESDLGQTGAAYLHFREFLRDVKGPSDRIPLATDAIAAMTKAGPWIQVLNLDKLPADATTLLDGVSLGPVRTTTDVPVKMGDHVIVVRVPGQPERRLSAYVHEGERREVDVGPKEPRPDRPLRPVGFVVGGVGLGSLIAGITTGSLAIRENDNLIKACGPKIDPCSPDVTDLEDRKQYGKNLTMAANVTFIVGGALTALGATFVFLPPSKSRELAFAPLVLPGGGGLSVGARF